MTQAFRQWYALSYAVRIGPARLWHALRAAVRGGRIVHVGRALRVSAASVALFALLGVGHILPAFHFALVAHRVCAEHGELLHESAPAAAPVARSSEVSLVAGGLVAHEHEHCGVLALPGSLAVPASSTVTLQLAATHDATSAPGHALGAHVGISLLLYAPKLAPPA